MASYSNKGAQFVAYDTAAATTKKTTQVVMLYDGLIKIMQQARKAIEDKEYEDRYNLIERALQIVAGLQGSLDFDNGGELAELLDNYYGGTEIRLLLIQGNNDTAMCDQIIKELKIMRDSWYKVDKKINGEAEVKENAGAKEDATEAAEPEAPSGVQGKTPAGNEIASALASISVSV